MQFSGSSVTWSSQFVFLLQRNSVLRLFQPSCCSLGWYKCLYKPSSGSTFSYGCAIDDHRRFLVALLAYNTSQIFNKNGWYFFRVLKLLGIHGLKQMFLRLFTKGFHEVVWVYLNLVGARWTSTLFFSRNFVTSVLNIELLSY